MATLIICYYTKAELLCRSHSLYDKGSSRGRHHLRIEIVQLVLRHLGIRIKGSPLDYYRVSFYRVDSNIHIFYLAR